MFLNWLLADERCSSGIWIEGVLQLEKKELSTFMVCEPDDDHTTKPYAFHFPHNVAGIDMNSFAIIDKVCTGGNNLQILVCAFRNMC